ncbi:Amidase signature domain [Dillenia turbinata]|uniref:Amidase signature domain n=1 Tax=Dillenia turbinata TaxID=194707 RepID=A0AAN8V879_9MAGN
MFEIKVAPSVMKTLHHYHHLYDFVSFTSKGPDGKFTIRRPPGALGIDTVGGVRVPATFCGTFGFRPSYGAVSNMGTIPVSSSLNTIDETVAFTLSFPEQKTGFIKFHTIL